MRAGSRKAGQHASDHVLQVRRDCGGSCLAAGAARADDDQDCDNIMDELKKLSERLMNTTDPKGIGPVCAATGQLLGIIKASREVAAECYDEGRKRDQILLTFDKASKDMESKIDSVCK